MTAFFFDEDDPNLDMIFGPQCAAPIVKALTKLGSTYRLLRGSLLHSRYCYDLSSISLRNTRDPGSEIGVTSTSQNYQPNMDHYLTIICDLAETMVHSGSSLSEAELQNLLAKKNVWVVVVQGLEDAHLTTVEASLSGFSAYLGWVKVDRSNPIHFDLFSESLFRDAFVEDHYFYKMTEWQEEGPDLEEARAILEMYGAGSSARLLDAVEFEKRAPALISFSSPSERGDLSIQRASGDAPTHRQRLASALLLEPHEAQGGFRSFETSRPEANIEFQVPEAKLTKYLLNLEHKDGGPKAKFFLDTLGITKADWRFLADQLCQAAKSSEFYRLKVTQYGVMHGAQVLVLGRNGRAAVVETGWKFEEDGPGTLVTAYPGDQGLAPTLTSFLGRVPPPELQGPGRWLAIHTYADEHGKTCGEEKVPTPMVLEKWGTVWEGACGFGWVRLPSGRHSFAKWVCKNGIGYQASPGVHISSPLPTQSIDKNLAYAKGYAEVLLANGIDCSVDSRLD